MTEFTGGRKNNDIDFGDFVEIEMFRHGVPNEFFLHKVVGAFKSNTWIETPLKWDSKQVGHNKMELVLNVIQCGIDETRVIRVAQKDCKKREES